MPEHIIQSAELHEILGSVVLLDVREPEEYEESRIEGCILIPLGELQARAPKELKLDSDIVIYCGHGVRSVHGMIALQRLGFKKVRSLEGGIAHYEELFPVSR